MYTFPNPLNIMFTGAGGNFQSFDFWSPRVSVNFAGNPAIEREVTEVARKLVKDVALSELTCESAGSSTWQQVVLQMS